MSQESSDRHGTGRGLIDALMFVLFVLFTPRDVTDCLYLDAEMFVHLFAIRHNGASAA